MLWVLFFKSYFSIHGNVSAIWICSLQVCCMVKFNSAGWVYQFQFVYDAVQSLNLGHWLALFISKYDFVVIYIFYYDKLLLHCNIKYEYEIIYLLVLKNKIVKGLKSAKVSISYIAAFSFNKRFCRVLFAFIVLNVSGIN
jgi:hypothetical protein